MGAHCAFKTNLRVDYVPTLATEMRNNSKNKNKNELISINISFSIRNQRSVQKNTQINSNIHSIMLTAKLNNEIKEKKNFIAIHKMAQHINKLVKGVKWNKTFQIN